MLGRKRELAVLEELLDGARAGRGGVLVLRGEPGVGKTALLEYAVEGEPEFRVARTFGVEAEMELPFAAVQQLCSPFMSLSERLPQPQHDALDVAFGLRATGTDKEFVFAAARGFVMPSYSESFGNSALEAMQRGLPVIVTRERVGRGAPKR